jgi:hypothetical protein
MENKTSDPGVKMAIQMRTISERMDGIWSGLLIRRKISSSRSLSSMNIIEHQHPTQRGMSIPSRKLLWIGAHPNLT